MKTSTITIVSACLVAMAACEKLELPTSEETKEESPVSGTPDTPDIPAPETAAELRTREDTIRYIENRGMTEDTPYSISDVRNIIPHYLEIYGAIQMQNCYIGGFIVGYVPQRQQNVSKTIFSAGQAETNIVMADFPDEIDHNKCIAVQLTTTTPSHKEVRDGLNLATHPENLGRFVIVCGHIKEYMRAMGVKNVKDAILYQDE